MGPIWGREDPDEPHFGPMNRAIRDATERILVGFSKEIMSGERNNSTLLLQMTQNKISGAISLPWFNLNIIMDM